MGQVRGRKKATQLQLQWTQDLSSWTYFFSEDSRNESCVSLVPKETGVRVVSAEGGYFGSEGAIWLSHWEQTHWPMLATSHKVNFEWEGSFPRIL